MSKTKQSSNLMSSTAAQVLRNPNASTIQKSLAGSVLSQANTNKVTGQSMEVKAGRALQRDSSSALTKSLAGSVVSQSKK
jgi:hypothetical protein